jgi:DNA-binding GntR family transcriptional regulator
MAVGNLKQSSTETAYCRLRDELFQGTLKPGQRLSEPELALRFAMSRSPIREALVRLEHEGFIERTLGGAARVKPLDIEEFEQLYVLRATVEGLAARLATPRLRTIDLEEMAAKIDEMEQSARKRSWAGAIAAGKAFHDVITRECGNPLLVEILAGLRARIERFRLLVASIGEYDSERIAEYRRILKAFYQRDAKKAEEAMVAHVDRSAAAFIKRLQKRAIGRP